ncbi:hypothetical protein Sango_2900300 [Sesamum angolense]|uniref:RNase H type-1 domain-containing protein n=1 Tax=Sesamum angolense TaxID=2727404 RepID=A0AAE1VUX6_9LAMI|nr:hypothetical protein Sango_2900300 [Sesamum angolense]
MDSQDKLHKSREESKLVGLGSTRVYCFSTIAGNGAGVVLTSPKEDKLEYVLCFDVKASNNEAGYEALIAGIRMALDAGAKNLIAHSNSQLEIIRWKIEKGWKKPLLDYFIKGIFRADDMEATNLKSRAARRR